MEHRRATVTATDGTRLAARLWLPDELPAPVVLEALPYRMDDLTATYASEYERLCEEGGLAVCRLDVRGTGSSGGIATDEYTAEEHHDICEVIAWLAAQAWSNGRVGMYGASWSGFNSLQVACLRPPALHAIAPIYASDDRYTDDVHYIGGALKAVDLVDWVLYMCLTRSTRRSQVEASLKSPSVDVLIPDVGNPTAPATKKMSIRPSHCVGIE